VKAPLNRRVFVVGYGAATPLGKTFATTWQRAVRGEAGFTPISRCQVDSLSSVVGEIPGWNPHELDFVAPKEARHWNADFLFLTMAVCKEALAHAGLALDDETGPRTGCLIGSALNGIDSFRVATENLRTRGPFRVSPYLLPSLCANVPSGRTGMLTGFTGPVFSPQGACASGNHAIGIGARMIRDGDCDFVLAGGVESCILPEIVHGFANMNATVKIVPGDRAYENPSLASRPFSRDRKGMVLSEGCGVVVLAAGEMLSSHSLVPRAEVAGVGWTSDAYHFTRPNPQTIVRAIRQAMADAELDPGAVPCVNAHGTSTPRGDGVEIECLREVYGPGIRQVAVSSNKSQIGHTLGAAAAIEAALGIESMNRDLVLPTINHLPDPDFADIDVVPDEARSMRYDAFLSNAFGFGGTNCCIVFKRSGR
jgi:3-oxoacyl-[acyl-carrier-protein] synthase II